MVQADLHSQHSTLWWIQSVDRPWTKILIGDCWRLRTGTSFFSTSWYFLSNQKTVSATNEAKDFIFFNVNINCTNYKENLNIIFYHLMRTTVVAVWTDFIWTSVRLWQLHWLWLFKPRDSWITQFADSHDLRHWSAIRAHFSYREYWHWKTMGQYMRQGWWRLSFIIHLLPLGLYWRL